MSTELKFAGNFLSLLSTSDSNKKIPRDYKKDLKEIPSISFISTKNLPKKRSHNSRETSTKTLHFKSIKPPKFNEELVLEDNKTIWEVKELLAKKLNLLSEHFKFLIKGKVIQDSTLVSDLSDINIIVMVKELNKEEAQADVVNKAKEVQWVDIEKVLNTKFSEDVVKRLHRGWELTE